jgi:hypothetical protein
VSNLPPGPLAEEAARLVEAITEWARGAVGDVSMPGLADGPECQICPVCQLLALLRRTQPETFGHLADASASMVAALRTVVDRHDHGRRASGVERIDLDNSEGADDTTDDTAPTRHDGDREALADALGVAPRRRPGRQRGPST